MAFNVGLSAAARILLLLLTSTVLHAEAEQARHATEKESPPTVTLRSLFRGTSQELHQYAESLLGTGVIRSAVEFLQMVIRCVAEGASSGLNVIAVYVTEILRVTGFDATFTLPRFTPEGVITVAQWGVLALMGYWGLTILLRLVVGTLRQVFWLVKMAVVLWLFAMIVSDKSASGDTTAVRLGGLVLAYILLSLLTSGSDQTGVLEHRLRSLEGRVKAVEKKKGNN
ncbi:voltage-gated monoatomic cation channel TMEM109 isoform X2 [Nerophis lumbriciformis]|uniref:voltage-gated monoatomic cation channel TMEM109 isoform X2 n=1 Tax=Nerophis lumbriciformis TaxID=546530 RepID=UPI002ADF2A04|nr:voltage-gated monoatomic cation channel TMEM109-like isoform X2 [Nerophis lumbriciformis]